MAEKLSVGNKKKVRSEMFVGIRRCGALLGRVVETFWWRRGVVWVEEVKMMGVRGLEYFIKSLTGSYGGSRIIQGLFGLEILMDGSQEHMQKQAKNKPKISLDKYEKKFAKVTLLG